MFPPQRIHPKFNYFQGGFSKRNGPLSQHSRGPGVGPEERISPSHIRTQAILAIVDWGFTSLQLARWILRWFIRFIYMLCHIFFFFWTLQTEGILKYCTYLMFLDDCWSLCRMLPTSDTNGSWQQEALIDIHFCAYATHCLGVLIDLRCKTLNLHFLFFQCWVSSSCVEDWRDSCFSTINPFLIFMTWQLRHSVAEKNAVPSLSLSLTPTHPQPPLPHVIPPPPSSENWYILCLVSY